MALTVDIVGPDGVRWSGQATFVTAPTVEGSIGLYPAHEPIMSVLKAGNVTVDDLDGKRSIVPISGGFLSFDEDTITVIADSDAPDGRES
jgi:F-type H+-transporting ATPase subunit epsilon